MMSLTIEFHLSHFCSVFSWLFLCLIVSMCAILHGCRRYLNTRVGAAHEFDNEKQPIQEEDGEFYEQVKVHIIMKNKQ